MPQINFLVTIVFVLLSLDMCLSQLNSETKKSEKSHHRQKRLFWITNDGRIALPPGTSLTITPTIALPFVRHPPNGFHSNITISLPFTSKKKKKNSIVDLDSLIFLFVLWPKMIIIV